VGAAGRVGGALAAACGSATVWDPACVVELCRLLGARGATVVLVGAASDVPFVEAVGRATRAPSLAGRDGPELLPALLAEFDALVSGDTGVAHLAAALGTPVAALLCPTAHRRTAPHGPLATV